MPFPAEKTVFGGHVASRKLQACTRTESITSKKSQKSQDLGFLSVELRKRKHWDFNLFRMCGLLLWLAGAQHDHCEAKLAVKAKEIWGNVICLSITKAEAKQNLQILICNRFRVDGTSQVTLQQKKTKKNIQEFPNLAHFSCFLVFLFWRGIRGIFRCSEGFFLSFVFRVWGTYDHKSRFFCLLYFVYGGRMITSLDSRGLAIIILYTDIEVSAIEPQGSSNMACVREVVLLSFQVWRDSQGIFFLQGVYGRKTHFSAVCSALESQGRANPAFSKPCLFLSDTRHFRHFRRFRGSEERNPCFQWVECKFVIFAVFVKTAPFWHLPKTRFVRPRES